MLNKPFSRFFKRSAKGVPPSPVKPTSSIDMCLSKISSHVRLDSAYREKVYGAILRRSAVIFQNAEKEERFLIEFLNQFERMLIKRRGLTIPVGIDAQNTQRYRDISTLVLSLIYFVKVLTKENLESAIQVEHEGVIYSFSFYQDYLYKSFSRVGIVRNKDSMVMTQDIESSLRVSILEDLLMNSPLSMQWFGMFPDMKRILYRSLQNVDESAFTMVSDEFIAALFSKTTHNISSEQNEVQHHQSSTSQTVQSDENLEVNRLATTEKPEPRTAIKRSSKLEALVGKAQNQDSSKGKSKVFNENSVESSPVVKPKVELDVSPAMQALISKSQSTLVESSQGEPEPELEIDFGTIAKECIREVVAKKALISIAGLVNKDGEIVYECCLIVPPEVWKEVVKNKVSAITNKKVWKQVESTLIREEVLIISNKGLSTLQSNIENIVAFDVSKLTESVQNDIELLEKDRETLQVNDLCHKNR